VRPTDLRKSNIQTSDAKLLETMSAQRRAAIMAIVEAGEASSVQHALFLEVARLIKLPD
jgi:hypothetical protein